MITSLPASLSKALSILTCLTLFSFISACSGGGGSNDNETPDAQYTLSTEIIGNGSVTSSPDGINCGSNCSERFNSDSDITLIATTADGFSFSGWSGGCSGIGICRVKMTRDMIVTARFLSSGTSGPELLTLKANETSGHSITKAKIRSGVPFPKGRLTQSDPVGLYDGDHLLPIQTKPLSVWGDGSIRWLLIDTEVALDANESKTLVLNKLSETVPVTGQTIDIEETADFLIVDTGPLKVEIPRLYGGIIHRATVNGEVIIDAPTHPITDRGAFISVFDSTNHSSTDYFSSLLKADSEPLPADLFKHYLDDVAASGRSDYNLNDPFTLEVVVEEKGPIHSVIKISGAHLNQNGMGFSTFIVRLHFYRGESSINVAHTLVYTGDETRQIKRYGLKLPMGAGSATTLIEGSIGNSADGEVRHIEFGSHEVNGVTQQGAALGYIGRQNNSSAMSIILRDMAERFPKSLVASGNGLEIQLYPESINPWNLTKYTPEASETEFPSGSILAEIATKEGETTRFTNHLFLRGAQGLSTTDDYVLNFASGELDNDALRIQAKIIDEGPVLLVADAKWYSDAGVMGVGPFAFNDQLASSEGGYRIDNVLRIARDFMRYNQRIQFDWFGIEDYGDIRGRFFGSLKTKAWWYKKGRYGWSGNSGEPSNQLWVQYLRKPDQQTFRDAEALARHTLDQQTVHFATSKGETGTELDGRNMFNSVGSLHRHGVQPFSGYAGSPDYSHVGGVETYFYLTGDQRAKEVLYEQAQFITRQNDPKTGIKNGLDVVDRAAAVFFETPAISAEFNAKADVFMNYLNSEPNGNGYNAVEVRLIDLNGNGVHDKDEGATNRGLFQSGFEYFMRGAPGLLYHHERTQNPVAGNLILDVANLLTVGDPKNPSGSGDDWELGLDGHAGSYFYHMNSIAYAAYIAQSLGVDDSAYYALAKRCVENNTHGGADNNDTSPILLDTLRNLPIDWTQWTWAWQENGSLGFLWLHRMIMYQNDTIQDYHSYRAFIHLATAAAIIKPGDVIELR